MDINAPIPYSDGDLLDRVLRNACEPGEPKWVTVRNRFGVGAGVARAICRRFGFDPDLEGPEGTLTLPPGRP